MDYSADSSAPGDAFFAVFFFDAVFFLAVFFFDTFLFDTFFLAPFFLLAPAARGWNSKPCRPVS